VTDAHLRESDVLHALVRRSFCQRTTDSSSNCRGIPFPPANHKRPLCRAASQPPPYCTPISGDIGSWFRVAHRILR